MGDGFAVAGTIDGFDAGNDGEVALRHDAADGASTIVFKLSTLS